MRVLRLWKPYGVLCQFTDSSGRPTLADYVREEGVYAAGRLDMDSEGLLILTDHGPTNARLTQPKFAHPRTYWVQVEGQTTPQALSLLRAGPTLNDGPTRPVLVSLISPPLLPERSEPIRVRKAIPTSWLEVTLTEGRNRQVRRMTAAVGLPTLRLVRAKIGQLTLDGLQEGECQPLSRAQMDLLLKA